MKQTRLSETLDHLVSSLTEKEKHELQKIEQRIEKLIGKYPKKELELPPPLKNNLPNS